MSYSRQRVMRSDHPGAYSPLKTMPAREMERKYWLVLSAGGRETGASTAEAWSLFSLHDFWGAVLREVGKCSDEHDMKAWLVFRAAVRDLWSQQFKPGWRAGAWAVMYHSDSTMPEHHNWPWGAQIKYTGWLEQTQLLSFIRNKTWLSVPL